MEDCTILLDDLSKFSIDLKEHGIVSVQIRKKKTNTWNTVALGATNGTESYGLLFQYNDEGLCSHTPYVNGTVCAGTKQTYAYKECIYEHGYYDADEDSCSAHYKADDGRSIKICASNDRVQAILHTGSEPLLYALLLTIAKLISCYVYSPTHCKALDTICDKVTLVTPTLNGQQLSKLKEEFPAVYEEYVNGNDIDWLRSVLLHIKSQ